MPYSKFTLDELKQKFNIILTGNKGKFNNLPEVAPSQFILEALEEYLPLAVAIGSEKARSELIVAPILVAIKKHLNKQISLFSGIEFNVDIELGLNGFCDFIISNSKVSFLKSLTNCFELKLYFELLGLCLRIARSARIRI